VAPERIGGYRIESMLGSGGMSVVYRAVQPGTNRVIALKVLAPALEGDPAALDRFSREAKAAASLRHHNIVTIYEANVDTSPRYIAMEYLEGGTLADRLRARRIPVVEALSIADQISSGLEHAHRRGVVHRDVKPSNVMFDAEGRVVITDFGIARAGRGGRDGRMGTPQYMSPEQAKGQEADHRSDVYSLAVLVYEMLTGRVPFSRPEPLATLRQVAEDPPPPPRRLNPALPPRVDRVLLRALDKNPDRRYQSAQAFHRELLAACRSPGKLRGTRPSRRRGALVGGVIAGLLVAALLLTGLLMGREPLPAGPGPPDRRGPPAPRGGATRLSPGSSGRAPTVPVRPPQRGEPRTSESAAEARDQTRRTGQPTGSRSASGQHGGAAKTSTSALGFGKAVDDHRRGH